MLILIYIFALDYTHARFQQRNLNIIIYTISELNNLHKDKNSIYILSLYVSSQFNFKTSNYCLDENSMVITLSSFLKVIS